MEHSLSLLELNQLVKQSIEQCLPQEYWIEAEISEMHRNNNGICYLEFLQNIGDKCVAKAKGIIWSNNYVLIKSYFEDSTKQTFVAGIKVRVLVTVNFHEVFGFSLNVSQIDPAYTLGDMALRRQQILKQLKEEGVIDMNKELDMPLLPQHIAVISSSTAAGYGDFCNQIQNNSHGFFFYTELFQAVMQGDQAEHSILDAMQRVDKSVKSFDVLVIIRGGGSTSDLSCFDSYLLAAAVAQFRIPVITGIGHERDDTVLDRVAHTRVKTPTAAANLLIDKVTEAADCLYNLAEAIESKVALSLSVQQQRLLLLRANIPAKVMQQLSKEKTEISICQHRLFAATNKCVSAEKNRLQLFRSKVTDASPDKILQKGYSITYCNGKVVKQVSEITKGEQIETKLYKGSVYSNVEKIKLTNTD